MQKAKKEVSIKDLAKLSEKLYSIRRHIEKEDEAHRKVQGAFKEIRDLLQAKLLEAMNHHGLKSLKTVSGDSFYIGSKKSINITNLVFALKWARENHCYNVDKRLVAQKLKDMDKVPSGFEVIEGEYIGVKKPKEKALDGIGG